MRTFLSNDLEVISYGLFCVAFFIQWLTKPNTAKAIMLFYYLAASFLIFYASNIAKANGNNNNLYNLLSFLTILGFSLYFLKIIQSRIGSFFIFLMLILNLVLYFSNIYNLKTLHTYNSSVKAFVFLSIVAYSFAYFYQVLYKIKEESIFIDFNFWFISSGLLYFFGSFFIVAFYTYIDVDNRADIWMIQNIILFISSVISLTGSIWIRYQSKIFGT